VDGGPGADLEEHARAAHAPGALAHRQFLVELQVAGLELLEGDQRRHQLAHRGRRQRLVRVLLEEDVAAAVVDQDRRPGRRLERGLRPRGAGRDGRGEQDECRKKPHHGVGFPFDSTRPTGRVKSS